MTPVTTNQSTTMSADKKVSKFLYYFFYVCRLENESDDELESIRRSESVLSAFEYVSLIFTRQDISSLTTARVY